MIDDDYICKARYYLTEYQEEKKKCGQYKEELESYEKDFDINIKEFKAYHFRLQTKYINQQNKCYEIFQHIIATMDRLDYNSREIIKRRYIDGQAWTDADIIRLNKDGKYESVHLPSIAESMHVSRDHCFHLHRKALLLFGKEM